MTAADRAARTRAADELVAAAYAEVGAPEVGVAMVAVGGYGREELAPYSDLDIVLVHDEGVELGEWAGEVWYPLWDSGSAIDHSVRSLEQMLAQGAADLRVALGMLDLRHLAGDPNLTLRLRTAVLAQWRRDARSNMPQLRRLADSRAERLGELAHAAIPDVKESLGGIRDATLLKGLVATWLVDVPHADLERCRQSLLDVRDAVHEAAGRATDRVAPELWPEIAERLELPDAVSAQLHTRGLGRRLTHISRITWQRVDAVLRKPAGPAAVRRPQLTTVAPGVAISHDEVVLDKRVRPTDPVLLLRAAAEAAERRLVLAPATVARLVRAADPLPDPWPVEARDLMVRLLAAGPGLLSVWETLEETGAIERVLPEWQRVRLLPHASVVHRFTVDRHMVETCIEGSSLLRRVARPDVLMVAALLHDIGKGEAGDHSVAGEPLAREIATRMGFEDRDADLVGWLVRWHLLLPETATRRDVDDPATIETVLERVPGREELDLLYALTEADARATSEKAWSTWRASLITTLVRRTRTAIAESTLPEPEPEPVAVPARVLADPDRVAVEVSAAQDGSTVRVFSGDRVGLLADAAAMLALQRVSVRAARAWTQETGAHPVGVSQWQVDQTGLDAAVLRQRLEAIVAGRLDPAGRLRRPAPARLEPTVAVRPEASERATVLEVRADDRPGLIHTACRALAMLGLSVRSAHVTTLGPAAVDVFYVQEFAAGALTDDRAAAAAHAVRAALQATVAD